MYAASIGWKPVQHLAFLGRKVILGRKVPKRKTLEYGDTSFLPYSDDILTGLRPSSFHTLSSDILRHYYLYPSLRSERDSPLSLLFSHKSDPKRISNQLGMWLKIRF